MTPNRELLISIIEKYHDELIATICRRLQHFQDSHYEVIDYESHVEREERFLNALLAGLQNPADSNFLNFVEQLSETRSEEGYSLEEFQEAFNIVEDSLWNILVREYGRNNAFIEMWSIIAQVFRRAKDRLAQIYLDKALSAERELEHLRKKFRAYRKVEYHSHV